MFYDETKVQLNAGKGGDGCVSFLREKYIPKGGPNGGNGGKGGDVLMVADVNVGDLRAFHFNPLRKAKNGEPGRGSDQHGKGGADCLLKVPLGTVVQHRETGKVIHELLEEDQEIVLLEGGKGGRGNMTFRTSVNQTPRQFTGGKLGEEGEFLLTLKTIADVGLVGFPNAGKSTLLNVLSNATPKVDSYPFTTLFPSVGIIEYPEDFDRITMADIPGLIEGAAENRGLGHRFLRHVERCRLILILLDLAATDGRDPLEDFAQLRSELEQHDSDVAAKPFLVAGNKMDEEAASEHLERFRQAYPELAVFPISAILEEGLPELKVELRSRLR
ncbi:MAG: GTPase ObgE [Opitutales bacterium]